MCWKTASEVPRDTNAAIVGLRFDKFGATGADLGLAGSPAQPKAGLPLFRRPEAPYVARLTVQGSASAVGRETYC